MLMSRALSRVSRSVGGRGMPPLAFSMKQKQQPIFSNHLISPTQVSLLHHSAFNSSLFQRFGFTSSTSPEPNEKDQATSGEEQAKTDRDAIPDQQESLASEETKESGLDSESQPVKRRRGAKRTAFSDSESEDEEFPNSVDELKKIVREQNELLKLKDKEKEQMQDKVVRTYAEMENILARTNRESQNSKKFAIQNFAKSLLDVADNLGRASSIGKESFSKIDASNDTSRVVPILKTLLEGVEMTEKQLTEVFKKFGLERFDPTNEPFDPNRHNAVFQVPDASKPGGTVAHVLKAGYTLHERVIRPAEVGVTQEVENGTNEE